MVMDPEYAHVPGVSYLDVEVSGETYRFAQDSQAPSVMPEMLAELVSPYLIHSPTRMKACIMPKP